LEGACRYHCGRPFFDTKKGKDREHGMSKRITHTKLADLVGGRLVKGAAEGEVIGLNSISAAASGEVTFLGNTRYAAALLASRATAVLVPTGFSAEVGEKAVIEVDNPTLAFSTVIRFFGPDPKPISWGVHPSAVVSESAVFDPQRVSIGPGAVVGEDVKIGCGTIVGAGVYVGDLVVLGGDCVLHPNVVIRERCVLGNRVIIHSGSVIGSDGFGYELQRGRHQKIDQVGIVQIDDDVEIGSCTTIDRARFGRTWIGEGSKIDNLVQIGHNCVLGKHCVIVSQTGISGSTILGNYVTMGGQVGVAGHLEISDKVLLLAKSGVTKSIPEPGAYTGYPARPLMEGRKMLTYPGRVPELLDRIKKLEKQLAAIEKASQPASGGV
jgi:UDP-3-O-[3-hydroxymyristoyl] glucosamine N-acyltransferase